MAKLLAQFALRGLLNPVYLVSPEQLPKGNPLSDPPRYWSGMAASRLDGPMKHLDARDRATAKAMLGKAESFRAKCEQFFEDAVDDLLALKGKGVSPNIIGASMVLYAWDWTVPARTPAYALLKTRTWQQLSAALDRAASAFEVLQPVALLADLHSRPRAIRKEEGILATLESVRRGMETLRTDLAREVRLLQKWRGTGRLADEKINILLFFLASVVRACSGHMRLEHVGRLVWFARLPGVRGKYLDPQHVRQRLATIKGTPLADAIEMEIAAALQAAARLQV